MKTNQLINLEKLGQSVWMDFIRRGMLASGELSQRISDDGITGVTSNPSIFEKAISGSHDYDDSVRAMALEGKSVEGIYRELVIEDIRRAADSFLPIYERTKGGDGYVSLEVSPKLARDSERTVREARELWQAVNRPNVYIKVPGTTEGVNAVRDLISEGINVNVTLLFSVRRYTEVAEAYLAGLESRLEKGLGIGSVSSVASFFLSRIDSAVDKLLEEKEAMGETDAARAASARGQVAIASAKLAYEAFSALLASDRFRKLASKGARPQRLLWASTSTKNPAYSDVKYVEALIGTDTINTLPLETMNAYRDHGNPAARLGVDMSAAKNVMEHLPKLGVDIESIARGLEEEGIRKFESDFDSLMKALAAKRGAALKEPVDSQRFSLGSFEKDVRDRVALLKKENFIPRLWMKDASLWKDDDPNVRIIKNSLGWLHVADKIEEVMEDLNGFAAEVKKAGFKHAVHMGMGGSSLAPLVLQESFKQTEGGIPLTVLDTTDPATILKIEREVPLAETLFIVASKSGTTAEPNAFGDYFYDRVKSIRGAKAGDNFVAITDPGSKLIDIGKERHFRRIFLNFSDIGGRYSALSYFGLVPAVLYGIDVREFLARALRMSHACDSCVPAELNPGLALGAAMGELALKGRDKVTFVVSKKIATLGLWLEQLIAESTGKEGKGILPVSDEPLLESAAYGKDRLFVRMKFRSEADADVDGRLMKLHDAGHPTVTVELEDEFDLAQEFFRWEIATAVAGAVIGINPFDQPNVQESKDNTNRLLAEVRSTGKLPEESPAVTDDGVRVFGEVRGSTLAEAMRSFLNLAGEGDYVAFLGYLPLSGRTDEQMETVRALVQQRLRVTTTFGYGPRFLHSTGQYHKGGPNTGLFIQLTAGDLADAQLPGQPYSFSVFKRAQAFGDLEALKKHQRRAIRIDLGKDVAAGLSRLQKAISDLPKK